MAVNRRPSLSDVAERAGVARASVSRVLSGHPDVSPEMRERVLTVVEALGYEPNLLAQGLRRGTTKSVGFIVRDISSPVFGEVVLGAEVDLRRGGYSVLLANSEGRSDLDLEYIRLFQRRGVDGLLLSIADETDPRIAQELSHLKIPYVLVDREISALPQASSVVSGVAAGVREATEHLIGLGHTRLGLITSPLVTLPGRDVERGFREACRAHGTSGKVEEGPFSAEHGAAATQHLLDARSSPTAIVAGSNQILLGVLKEFQARSLRVPDDISLIAVDDLPLLEFTHPPISVVSREHRAMGLETAALLMRLIQGAEPQRISIPAKFIPRASCARPAGRTTAMNRRGSTGTDPRRMPNRMRPSR